MSELKLATAALLLLSVVSCPQAFSQQQEVKPGSGVTLQYRQLTPGTLKVPGAPADQKYQYKSIWPTRQKTEPVSATATTRPTGVVPDAKPGSHNDRPFVEAPPKFIKATAPVATPPVAPAVVDPKEQARQAGAAIVLQIQKSLPAVKAPKSIETGRVEQVLKMDQNARCAMVSGAFSRRQTAAANVQAAINLVETATIRVNAQLNQVRGIKGFNAKEFAAWKADAKDSLLNPYRDVARQTFYDLQDADSVVLVAGTDANQFDNANYDVSPWAPRYYDQVSRFDPGTANAGEDKGFASYPY